MYSIQYFSTPIRAFPTTNPKTYLWGLGVQETITPLAGIKMYQYLILVSIPNTRTKQSKCIN